MVEEENENMDDFDDLKKFDKGDFMIGPEAFMNDDNENYIENPEMENEKDNKELIGLEKEEGKLAEKNIDFEQEQDMLDLDQGEDDDSDDSKSDKRFPVEEQTDWIHWFCKLKGNEYFVEIDEDFIKNEENLTGIKCEKYIKTLLSEKPKNGELNSELIEDLQEIREIYGLIHKRFIQTQIGLGLVREKFLDGVYGSCPRLLCNKQVLLPVGLSEDARYSQVKVFCPLCQEVYKPRDIYYGYQGGKKIYKFDLPDGIFFGTSFPQIFLINFPDLDPRINNNEKYIPKLYGFRIFGKYGSKYYTNDQENLDKMLIKYGIKKV
jgi:casein kinase II subunit beta